MSLDEAALPPMAISVFVAALRGRRLHLIDRPEFGSPIRAYATLLWRTHRQFIVALDAVEELEGSRSSESWGKVGSNFPQTTADSVLNLAYRVSEVFEFFEKELPKYLDIESDKTALAALRAFRSDIKRLGARWKMICNKCKHNHRFPQAVDGHYGDGKHVTGVTFFRQVAGLIEPCPEIHSTCEVFSYNFLLRDAFSALVEADARACLLVRSLVEKPQLAPLDPSPVGLPFFGKFLKRIVERDALGMPFEPQGPVIHLDGLDVDLLPAEPPELRRFQMRLVVDVLDRHLKIRTPFSDGFAEFTIRGEEVVGGPMHLFVRAQIADLVVAER